MEHCSSGIAELKQLTYRGQTYFLQTVYFNKLLHLLQVRKGSTAGSSPLSDNEAFIVLMWYFRALLGLSSVLAQQEGVGLPLILKKALIT